MTVSGVKVNKGFIGRVAQDELVAILPFQFNPTETTRGLTSAFNYVSPAGSPMPTASFKSGGGSKITLELFFDAVEGYDENKEGVGAHRAFLESFLWPDVEEYSTDLGQFIAPPRALYSLGRDSFHVVVDSVSFREVRRAPNADVTRMYAQLSLSQYWQSQYELRAWLHHLEALRQLVEVQPSAVQRGK